MRRYCWKWNTPLCALYIYRNRFLVYWRKGKLKLTELKIAKNKSKLIIYAFYMKYSFQAEGTTTITATTTTATAAAGASERRNEA